MNDSCPRGARVRSASRSTTEKLNERPITYELAIGLDSSGRPVVESERLKQRRKGESHGKSYSFLRLEKGTGLVWAGDVASKGKAGRSR